MKLTELNNILLPSQRKYDVFIKKGDTLIDLEDYKGIRINPNKKQVIIEIETHEEEEEQ